MAVAAVEREGGGGNDSGKRVDWAMLHRGAQWVLWNAKKSVEGSE